MADESPGAMDFRMKSILCGAAALCAVLVSAGLVAGQTPVSPPVLSLARADERLESDVPG